MKYMKPRVISAIPFSIRPYWAGSAMRIDFGDGSIFEGVRYRELKGFKSVKEL